MLQYKMAFNNSNDTNMEKGNIYEKINAFKLNDSVQVDIIFEDSNEDHTQTSQIKQEIDPTVNTNEILSPIFQNDTITQVKTESIDIVDKVNKVDTINLTEDDLPGMAVSNTINEKDLTEQAKIVDSSVYRKNSSITENSTKQSKFDLKKSEPITALSNFIHQIGFTQQLEAVETNSNKRNFSIENTNDQLGSHTKRTKINETTKLVARPEAPETVTKEPNNLEIYIKNLLKSVSEYLLYIAESYDYYIRVKHQNPTNLSEIEKWKNNFMRAKAKYFSFAYCTISNIIVPQENNPNFIKTFLDDTIALNTSLNKGIRTAAQIEPFLRELIIWTKHAMEQKKQRLQEKPAISQFTNNSNFNALSTIHKNYTQPSRASEQEHVLYTRTSGAINTTSVIPANVDTSQKLILFEQGPPGREISISLPAPPHRHTYYQNQINNIPVTNPQLRTTPVQHQGQFSMNGQIPQAINPGTVELQSRHAIKNPVSLSSVHQPHSINPVQANFFRNGSQRPPPPWSKPPYMVKRNIPAPKQNVAIILNANEVQNTEIRSLSRDSGFGSPLCFGNSSEPMNNENVQTHDVQNPVQQQLQYHKESKCHVCGSNTRKMCISCVAQYYCSIECQYADWPVHMLQCKPKE